MQPRVPFQHNMRVAACITGNLRSFPDMVSNIKDRLLEPLGADVFTILTYHNSSFAPAVLQALQQLKIVSNRLLPAAGNLRTFMNEATVESKAKLLNLHKNGHVSNALSPWLGPQNAGCTYNMQAQAMCLEDIERAEENTRNLYDWVIWLRCDTVLFTQHPALEHFSLNKVWVPDGLDYFGLFDRFALIPRKFANVFLGRWPGLLDGSAWEYFAPELNAEMFLKAHLKAHNVPVARYPRIVGLGQCGDNKCYFGQHELVAGFHLRRPHEAMESIILASLLEGGYGWPICRDTKSCESLVMAAG